MAIRYVMRQIFPNNLIETGTFTTGDHRSSTDINEAYRRLENYFNKSNYRFQIEEEEY